MTSEEGWFDDEHGRRIPYLWFAPQAAGAHPGRVVLFLPGFDVAGSRYTWLGEGLAERGFGVLITNPSPAAAPHRDGLHRFSTIDQFARAAALAVERMKAIAGSAALIAGGHSQGGKIVLETLAAENGAHDPFGPPPPGYQPPAALAGVFALGSTMDTARTADGRHHKPLVLPVLLVTGERDALMPEAGIRGTAEDFDGDVALLRVANAGHYGWCAARPLEQAHESAGNEDMPMDGRPAVWATTVDYLATFTAACNLGHVEAQAAHDDRVRILPVSSHKPVQTKGTTTT